MFDNIKVPIASAKKIGFQQESMKEFFCERRSRLPNYSFDEKLFADPHKSAALNLQEVQSATTLLRTESLNSPIPQKSFITQLEHINYLKTNASNHNTSIHSPMNNFSVLFYSSTPGSMTARENSIDKSDQELSTSRRCQSI